MVKRVARGRALYENDCVKPRVLCAGMCLFEVTNEEGVVHVVTWKGSPATSTCDCNSGVTCSHIVACEMKARESHIVHFMHHA